LDVKGSPDLSILIQAVKDVSPYLSRETILISESTSFPGTLRNLIAPIVLSLSKFGNEVLLATAPERVDPGNLQWNQRNTPRLIGGLNEKSTSRAVEVYSQISSSLQVVSSPEIAEAAKLLENSFRLINIAFINEFAQAMANLGINALEVIEAANTKPYGFMRFIPGLGAGGHCIPVDPVYLSDFFSKSNAEHKLLKSAISSNREAFKFVVKRVRSLTIQPKRILLIGLSYKEGISDLRESPAEQVFRELDAEYEVDFYDERILSIENLKRSEALKGFDLVLILVPQKNLNLETLVSTNTIVWNCTGTLITVPGVTNIYDGSEND
jgi:UDP-N-acetyl-D-glucosamine dehydrogenase